MSYARFETVLCLGILCFLAYTVGCGPHAGASGARAVEIPGPVNTVCFAIVDGLEVKGGNCVWAR